MTIVMDMAIYTPMLDIPMDMSEYDDCDDSTSSIPMLRRFVMRLTTRCDRPTDLSMLLCGIAM